MSAAPHPEPETEVPWEQAQWPPGPRGDTLFGSVLDFRENPAHFIRWMKTAYGDTTRFRMGPSWWYLVAHPSDIHDIFGRRAELFIKPRIAKRLWDKFLGDSVLSLNGEPWKRMHRMLRPAFHRPRIRAYGTCMVEYTHRMLDGWEAGQERDIDADMVQLTLEIVAKTLFDSDIREGAKTIGESMEVLQRELVNHINYPIPFPKWWPSESNRRKLKAISDMEEVVMSVVRERQNSGEDRGDLLSMMLLARDDEGNGLTDKELRDQAMTMIFAGHETTAHAMTWAWYLLARNPECTRRLQADIDRVTGGERLTVEHLADLPYLEWSFKEAMRVLPSVWVFMKETTEDVVMRGYRIPKGSQVMVSPWVTHHDERWYPSPETFDPDRWEKKRAAQLPPGAYMPFSGGLRVCLGKSFAMMEARLVLGSMLQRLDPVVPDDYRPKLKSELSQHPDGGLPIVVRWRDRGGAGRAAPAGAEATDG